MAAESLAKLGYSKQLDEIVEIAEKDRSVLQVYARWIMANSGSYKDESYLTELLNSENVSVRSNVGYALRHLKDIRISTWEKIKSAALNPSSTVAF